MKDGTTHLAHKAEHAVDLSDGGHGAILAVNVCDAAAGDNATVTVVHSHCRKSRKLDGIRVL
jgi:hypothetical protein